MNKTWSLQIKEIQDYLKKESSYRKGIEMLIILRNDLFQTIKQACLNLSSKDYCYQPFINHPGYDKKTVGYSLYHLFRIEDICLNDLITNEEEIFFSDQFQKKMNSVIITTGNELIKEQIADFSSQLNVNELWNYGYKVFTKTNDTIMTFNYLDLKRKVNPNNKQKLIDLHVVSDCESAVWLIDYWCNKSILGLMQMPFSRHWIMHIEASLKIINKLKQSE